MGSSGRLLVAGLVVALTAVGTTGALQGSSEPLSVVVTLQPWASLTRSIAGEHASVMTLLPAGMSPHAFDPLPSQALALAGADLVVMNGGLDDWLLRLIGATASGARPLVLLDVIDLADLESDPDHEGHGDSGVNPHIWLDPLLAARAVPAIAQSLAELDPGHAQVFLANAANLQRALAELDAELQETLGPVAGANIVPFHDAWVYFADRYGLNIVATLEPFPGREPSAAYLAATVAQIESAGVSVILTERQLNRRTASVVAESAGVTVAELDPIGGAPGPDDYFELLRHNAMVVLEALSGE